MVKLGELKKSARLRVKARLDATVALDVWLAAVAT